MPALAAAELVVDALLETPGPQVPAPGHAHWLSVCRYRVLKVLRGRFELPLVLVAHDGANMSSAEFLPDTRKELELSTTFPPHASLRNPFSNESPAAAVFYCVKERVIEVASGQ